MSDPKKITTHKHTALRKSRWLYHLGSILKFYEDDPRWEKKWESISSSEYLNGLSVHKSR